MWNNTLQTLMIGTLMTTSALLIGCSQADEDTSVVSDNPEQTVSDSATAQDQNASLASPNIEQAPVDYNIAAWNVDDVEPLDINEIDAIKATFGQVESTDENSLDYASNPASKYRFMDNDSPYLDLIDSDRYLELGWYYANPADSDEEKALSEAHAKKSYQLVQQLMGDEGRQLLANMLSGQIIKNKVIGGQQVELAKCEFYSCMLVLNKSAASVTTS